MYQPVKSLSQKSILKTKEKHIEGFSCQHLDHNIWLLYPLRLGGEMLAFTEVREDAACVIEKAPL